MWSGTRLVDALEGRKGYSRIVDGPRGRSFESLHARQAIELLCGDHLCLSGHLLHYGDVDL